ncbi:MAG: DUF5668 domain-containing protein [Acidimicrobiia bacterium]|nr:DUF5668 domain-containing protein [Acidimicrobiia bacterium]
MSKQQRRALVGGILFVLLGILFLLEALEVYELEPATLWPLLLVALGIAVLAGTGGDDEDNPAT